MQTTIPTSQVGITQINNFKPKQVITIRGVDYQLKKNATDASTIFPYQRLVWLNAGAIPVADGKAHACYIFGIIPPNPNSLETPVSVFAIGFHQTRLNMHPNYLSESDLQRMHYYTATGVDFATDFVEQFMGLEHTPPQQREPVSPFPPMINIEKEPENGTGN